MAITPINQQDLADRVHELVNSANFNNFNGNPTSASTTALLVNALERLVGNTAAGSTLSLADVTTAIQNASNLNDIEPLLTSIDSKVDLSAIRTALTALVTASAKRYTTTIFQDNTNTYYLYRYDENTGSFANLSLATGLAYTPVAPIRIPDSTDSHLVSERIYQVLNSASPLYAVGEELTKIVSRVNGAAVTIWINDSRGVELAIPPVIADVQPIEDLQIEILQAITNKIDQIGGVFVDGAYAGRTLYAARTNRLNEWAIGDLLSRRDVTVGGGLSGGVDFRWVNETQGQPVSQPNFLNDIEPIEIYLNKLLLNNVANTRSILLTEAAGSTTANTPTSRELTPGTIGLDVNVANGVSVTTLPDVTIGVLPAGFLADIASIKTNTGRLPNFSFELAEDTTGVTFFVRRDNVSGAVSLITLAGTLYTLPSGASIELTDPIITNRTVEINEFGALTTSSPNWTAGDILTRVRVVDSNTNPATIISTAWQKADGSSLAVVPVIGVDVEDTNKTALLTATATLTSIGNAADISLPATSAAFGTQKGLIRGVWNAIVANTTQLVAALANGFDIAKSTTAPGAAPATARLMAGIYNATLPTLTNGQSAALQTDSTGKLLVAGISGGVAGRDTSILIYRATIAGTGWAVNDLIEEILEWDMTAAVPAYLGAAYRNLTTQSVIAGVVPQTSMYPITGGTLTGNAAPIDRSGVIVLGATAQNAFPINANRQGCFIQNTSNYPLYINELGVASNTSYSIAPGAEWQPAVIGTGAISIWGETTGQTWVAREWNVPAVSGSTLFVAGATPGGQLLAANSFSVVPATNYTESVEVRWFANVTGAGYTAGDRLLQIVKSNGGTLSQTWINIITGVIIVTPTPAEIAANLSIDQNTGQTLGGKQRGRQSWCWSSDGVTGMAGSGTLAAHNMSSVVVDGVVVQGASSVYGVPAGKRLRICTFNGAGFTSGFVGASTATYDDLIVTLRQAAAVLTTSPCIMAHGVAWNYINPTAGNSTANWNATRTFQDGELDIAGGQQIMVAAHATNSTGGGYRFHGSFSGYLYNA
jgi:hypothetical protein